MLSKVQPANRVLIYLGALRFMNGHEVVFVSGVRFVTGTSHRRRAQADGGVPCRVGHVNAPTTSLGRNTQFVWFPNPVAKKDVGDGPDSAVSVPPLGNLRHDSFR